MGFVSPYVLAGKKIFEDECRKQKDWDALPAMTVIGHPQGALAVPIVWGLNLLCETGFISIGSSTIQTHLTPNAL